MIRKTLQISEKESGSVEISTPPFPLHLLEHRKRSYSALFCILRENKNSRFRLEIRSLLLFAFLQSGTTRNRTGDTRIFSPLLYQLSYGTIIIAFCECKDRCFLSTTQIFEHFSCQKCTSFRILLYLCTRKSGFSAVGSALRSGRRGRWFESSNPDGKRWKGNYFPPLF